jgi:hypothetical protein
VRRRKLLCSLGLAPFVTPSLIQRARAAGQDDDGEQLGPGEVEYLFVQTARIVSRKDVAISVSIGDRPQEIALTL